MSIPENGAPAPQAAPHKHKMPRADYWSIVLAVLTGIGLIVWTLITQWRGPVPTPTHWFTAAVPVWSALILLGLQMVCLVASAITATRREQMGIADMLTSIGNFVVIAGLCLLLIFGVTRFAVNLTNGYVAFLWTNGIEMFATIGVWQVANRRPGGVIGGLTQ